MRATSSGLAVVALAAVLLSALPARAASADPTLRIKPTRVALRGHALVTASHLPPHALLTLLFAVPDLQRHRVERLLGATHADAHGNVRVTVTIPIVTTCGAASLYLFDLQTARKLRAGFTITGCTAGSKGAVPPPPPGPHKP